MTGDRLASFLAALANAHRLFQNETALRGMLFVLSHSHTLAAFVHHAGQIIDLFPARN